MKKNEKRSTRYEQPKIEQINLRTETSLMLVTSTEATGLEDGIFETDIW